MILLEKICTKCGEAKPLDAFAKRAASKDGKQGICRSCKSETHRVWRNANPEKQRATGVRFRAKHAKRELHLKYRYHMTLDEWNTLFCSQGKSCAICHSTEPRGASWHVDHDHSCCSSMYSCGSCIRGILCHSCNTAIGHMNDDVSMLESAITYLNRS